MDTKAGIDPILTRAGVERTGAMYLAGQDPRQPLLSPAIMADLTGFPPILLQVGTNEVLLDDSTRLAARAIAAEVDVILDVTAHVPHVFQSFAGGPWTKPTRHWTVRRCSSASTSPPARRPRRRRPTDRRFPNRHRTGLNPRTSSGHHP